MGTRTDYVATISRRPLRTAAALSLIAAALAYPVATAPQAEAAGPGLPRTYDVIRVDSPTPATADTFAFGIVNAGDIDGDGEDDILASQGTRILNDGSGAKDGEVFVISGADGSTIAHIPAPEPDTNAAGNDRAAAFGFYLGRIGQRKSAAPFTDLGSCPGGDGADSDAICDDALVGPADGIPDILASAIHVDRASPAAADGTAEDIGRVYVIDGATRAVLKRIDMPQADVDDIAEETERLIPSGAATPVRPWFGRTVLNPAGLPPCAGNMGVGACAAAPDAVQRGDFDGGGSPDVIVGASAYKYEEADDQAVFGQNHTACDDTPALDTCIRSGRVYMYRGEDIVGSPPIATLESAAWNIKNPYAQADVEQTSDESTRIINQLELWGHSVSPVGDIGKCNVSPGAGAKCPPASVGGTPDGLPEVLVSAFRVDYPVDGPDNDEDFDIGVNSIVDGATGAVLQVFKHPDPDPGSLFGFQIYNQPVAGDMGGTAVPDLFIPAGGQDTDDHRGEGIGYLMNGAAIVSGNILDLQKFRDPTPHSSGSFGTTAAGVGDVAGDPRNEILVGEFSGHNPPQNSNVISDVHFFDPTTGDSLQTIPDPDQQPGSNFGIGLAPLGDLNEDGFLDFAAGAGRWDEAGATAACPAPPCSDVGRLYIFVSENRPPTTVSVSEGVLFVAGAPATASNIELSQPNAATVRVTDAPDPGAGRDGAPIEAGPGCVRIDVFTAECDATAISFVVVDAFDLDDLVDNHTGFDSTLLGGPGDDVLDAAGGFDFLVGNAGADLLLGRGGGDVLLGGGGDDDLRGGSGRDLVAGNKGDDRFRGGSGNDRLRARDRNRDPLVNCGRGTDIAKVDDEDPKAKGCETVKRR